MPEFKLFVQRNYFALLCLLMMLATVVFILSVSYSRQVADSECRAQGGTYFCQDSCICLAKGTVLP